jgi:hypothetical protein
MIVHFSGALPLAVSLNDLKSVIKKQANLEQSLRIVYTDYKVLHQTY